MISARCCLAASWARHFDIVFSRVSADSLSSTSTVSPSNKPSTIWSLMLFCVHSEEQKLHVFASSRKLTKKSSKASPCCCFRWRKRRRSTDSLIWPSTYWLIAFTMCVTLPRWSSDRPRFSTIVTVSLEKQSVSACTCLS